MSTPGPEWRPATRVASHPELVRRLAARPPLQFAASDVTPCARADDMAGMRVLCRLPAVLVLWHQLGSDALVLCFEVAGFHVTAREQYTRQLIH